MSPPEAVSTVSPQPSRRGWLWLSATAALFVIVALLLLIKTRQGSAAHTKQDLLKPAGAVPLGEFTRPETRRWQSAPRGTQACDGVTFVCNGAIRLAGLNAARDGSYYPGAVLGVPVNRHGTRIHLLQAAENSSDMSEGVAYGRIVFHYDGGESRSADLLFGIHGDDWFQGMPNSEDPVADPNSRVAWVQKRTGDRMTIRLYHTTLENSLPEKTITTIDFISPLSEANLLLFGVTIDDDARPLAASYGPGESIGATLRQQITFRLQNFAGDPAPEAILSWTAQGPRIRIDFPAFPADKEGRVVIEVPRKFIRQILYQASAPDGTSSSGELRLDPRGSFPGETVVKLKK